MCSHLSHAPRAARALHPRLLAPPLLACHADRGTAPGCARMSLALWACRMPPSSAGGCCAFWQPPGPPTCTLPCAPLPAPAPGATLADIAGQGRSAQALVVAPLDIALPLGSHAAGGHPLCGVRCAAGCSSITRTRRSMAGGPCFPLPPGPTTPYSHMTNAMTRLDAHEHVTSAAQRAAVRRGNTSVTRDAGRGSAASAVRRGAVCTAHTAPGGRASM